MAKFFKDPDGKLIAALGDDVATPAGCTELTANTEDAAHEKHVPVVETERDAVCRHQPDDLCIFSGFRFFADAHGKCKAPVLRSFHVKTF